MKQNVQTAGCVQQCEGLLRIPARTRLGASGRLVIRPSGTEPVIRVMAEGDDEKLVSQVVKDIVGAVKKVAA